jgi:hypothetical protein
MEYDIILLIGGKLIMSCILTHLAIADKIYNLWGCDVIKNLPLFFGGNIAPDAIHAKEDYQRSDKKHSHLCDGIYSYGYGYPDIRKLFKERLNEFIEKYYLPAGKDKDLYLGYVVHLLVDELEMFSAYERLESQLKSNGANPEEPGFRKNLADEVNDGGHAKFFNEDAHMSKILAHEYEFKQKVVNLLEAVWDYEVKDYISSNEINISKRWVINTVFKNEPIQDSIDYNDRKRVVKFIDFAAENIIEQLQFMI